jgi:hypothetical protein
MIDGWQIIQQLNSMKMELKLVRAYFPNGTNGELLLDGEKICATIELPWKENKRRISCIPEGRYELRKRYTPRLGKHFKLKDVPERSGILIHAANDAMKELKGCIAPVTNLTGQGKGTNSRLALARLVHTVYPAFENGECAWLEIMSDELGE